LFGVIVDTVKIGDQAAILADKIFKGQKAGNIPVISAESFLEINNKEATRMGIDIPSGLLGLADRIVK
jgi:putative tryptophan/tyrosine transport system substrate-binding protein